MESKKKYELIIINKWMNKMNIWKIEKRCQKMTEKKEVQTSS